MFKNYFAFGLIFVTFILPQTLGAAVASYQSLPAAPAPSTNVNPPITGADKWDVRIVASTASCGSGLCLAACITCCCFPKVVPCWISVLLCTGGAVCNTTSATYKGHLQSFLQAQPQQPPAAAQPPALQQM